MDFETWTDKNGTQWKVAEMTTRQIKKTIKEIYERLIVLGRKWGKGRADMVLYWVNWGGRFEMELKRRKRNVKNND